MVDDPTDARLGLAVSRSTGNMFIRAWTYRVGLIGGGHMIECNVSLYELSYTAKSNLPAVMHPCTIKQY